MTLSCPKCNSEDTKKLTLVMSQGGVAEKGAQLGTAYFSNIIIPMMTLLFAVMLGFMFMLANFFLGITVFFGVLFAGYALRKWVRAKTRSKYADLPAAMKHSGFQCGRCEHLFIPAG